MDLQVSRLDNKHGDGWSNVSIRPEKSLGGGERGQELLLLLLLLTAVFREPVGHGEATCACADDHIIITLGEICPLVGLATEWYRIGDSQQRGSRNLSGDGHF